MTLNLLNNVSQWLVNRPDNVRRDSGNTKDFVYPRMTTDQDGWMSETGSRALRRPNTPFAVLVCGVSIEEAATPPSSFTSA